MKISRIASLTTFGLAFTLLAGVAGAETSVTTSKTTTYIGTVSAVDPAASTIIVTSESAPDPTTYMYTSETSFVDMNGNVVSSATIKNAPVRIEYTIVDGKTIVNRVVQTSPVVVVTPPTGVIREKTTTHTETDTAN